MHCSGGIGAIGEVGNGVITERCRSIELESVCPAIASQDVVTCKTADHIREGARAYFDKALQAADAYTDGNRVIGNTLLAQARQGSDAVSAALESLVADLSEAADRTNRVPTQEAANSVRRAPPSSS